MTKASVARLFTGIAPVVLVALMIFGRATAGYYGDGLQTLRVIPWSLGGAIYRGENVDISVNTANARSVDFSPDGTRMYVVGRGTQNVAEYHLIIPWEIRSAVFLRELKIDAPVAHGLFFNKENGTDMYVLNRTELLQFRLAVPWDVTMAKHVRTKTLSCGNTHLRRGHDIHFKADGTRFYVEDRVNQEVYEYTLSEPWNIESMSWRFTLDIADRQKAVRGIEIDPSGTRMWLMDTGSNNVLEYDLGAPWSLESARFNHAMNLDDVSSNTRGITWRPDGLAFYITSTGHQRIYQFMIR